MNFLHSRTPAIGAGVPARAAPRRQFLQQAAAAAVGAAAVGAPASARAEAITLRVQSTWGANDIFHEYASDFAARVNALAGGRLKIDLLPVGAVVRAFDLVDAVDRGLLDGGTGLVAYWYGKNSATALWGSGPAFGMDANMVLAWHYYGGGRQLLEEIYQRLDLDVVSLLYGPMPTQPLGWFNKAPAAPADFKGLRFRTVGLTGDVMAELGAAVNPLPGTEIVPAMERGLIDGAEFNNVSSDRALGLAVAAKVCMLQSYHQASEQFEILFNRSKYTALPADLKAGIDIAVQASSADMSWKAIERYSRDYAELRSQDKVEFRKTPSSILRAQLEAWDRVAARKSEENPMFKRVLNSMREFAARAGRWQYDTTVDNAAAFNRYFGAAASTGKA